MNRSEAARILTLAAARDQRTIGDADVMAWAQDLADIDFDDAREAVSRHYQASTVRLLPAHIRELVRVIRDERRRHEPHPIRSLPSRFEDDDDRIERAHRGAALCRAELETTSAAKREEAGDPDNPVRDAALRRARTETKGRQPLPPRPRRATTGEKPGAEVARIDWSQFARGLSDRTTS